MLQENNEPILVKAIYFSKSGIIGEQIFTQEVTLGDILYYFNTNLKQEFLNIKKNYIFNNVFLDEYCLIKNLINLPNDGPYIIEINIEINEEEILDDEFDPIITKIIKPKFYPFSLFVYSPKEGKITLEEYTSNISKEFNLKKISSGSSYCNSPDSLYISGGGVYYKNPINDFWIINKEDYSIELKKMPMSKRDHSMIYIPNQFVLIAGGGDNKCIIYDIQKKIFFNWADLNNIHYKPALFILNNYIYCFSELNKVKNYFERINISDKYPKWEKIFPKFRRNVYLYNKKIFFVSKCVNNLIIFGAGDNKRQSKIYLYNLSNNEVSISEDKCDIEELDNKTFDKVSEFYNVAIPKYYDRERNILILNKKKKKIKKIFFSENKVNKIKIFEKDEIYNDKSIIKIDIKPYKNFDKKRENLDNKLNYIKKNIEDINVNNISNTFYKNYNNFNTEYYSNDKGNSIEEISEDDEEKYENNLENNRNISTSTNFNKYYNERKIGYIPNTAQKSNYIYRNNNNNLKSNNSEGVYKIDKFEISEEFFNNKNIVDNKEEDDIQLSRIIKNDENEFDSTDKFSKTERNLLSQIGSVKKELFNSGKRVNPITNRLPQVKQNNFNKKTVVLNDVNFKIENDRNVNYKKSRYYTMNNKDED